MSYISEKYPDLYVVEGTCCNGNLGIVKTLEEAVKLCERRKFEGQPSHITFNGKVVLSVEEQAFVAHCLEVAKEDAEIRRAAADPCDVCGSCICVCAEHDGFGGTDKEDFGLQEGEVPPLPCGREGSEGICCVCPLMDQYGFCPF